MKNCKAAFLWVLRSASSLGIVFSDTTERGVGVQIVLSFLSWRVTARLTDYQKSSGM